MNIRSNIVAVGDEFECPHCGHMIGALDRAYCQTDVPGGENITGGWLCSPRCLKMATGGLLAHADTVDSIEAEGE